MNKKQTMKQVDQEFIEAYQGVNESNVHLFHQTINYQSRVATILFRHLLKIIFEAFSDIFLVRVPAILKDAWYTKLTRSELMASIMLGFGTGFFLMAMLFFQEVDSRIVEQREAQVQDMRDFEEWAERICANGFSEVRNYGEGLYSASCK